MFGGAATRRRCSASCRVTRGPPTAIPKLGPTIQQLYSEVRRRARRRGDPAAAAPGARHRPAGGRLQLDRRRRVLRARHEHGRVDGGAVIQITDKAKATSAFGKLIGLLRTQGGTDARPVKIDGAEAAFEIRRPGAPKPIVVARGSDKAVITYGAEAAKAALSPDAKLVRVGHLRRGEVAARRRRRADRPGRGAAVIAAGPRRPAIRTSRRPSHTSGRSPWPRAAASVRRGRAAARERSACAGDRGRSVGWPAGSAP